MLGAGNILASRRVRCCIWQEFESWNQRRRCGRVANLIGSALDCQRKPAKCQGILLGVDDKLPSRQGPNRLAASVNGV